VLLHFNIGKRMTGIKQFDRSDRRKKSSHDCGVLFSCLINYYNRDRAETSEYYNFSRLKRNSNSFYRRRLFGPLNAAPVRQQASPTVWRTSLKKYAEKRNRTATYNTDWAILRRATEVINELCLWRTLSHIIICIYK